MLVRSSRTSPYKASAQWWPSLALILRSKRCSSSWILSWTHKCSNVNHCIPWSGTKLVRYLSSVIQHILRDKVKQWILIRKIINNLVICLVQHPNALLAFKGVLIKILKSNVLSTSMIGTPRIWFVHRLGQIRTVRSSINLP
jgi:hypothetical protein